VSTERAGPATDVTRLLLAWSDGEEAAAEPLMDAVYQELRRLARAYVLRERPDHSLSPTGLVHEAYLRLVDQKRARWQNRAHFFAVASKVMRRLLVDHARARGASKRGSGLTVSLDDVNINVDGDADVDLGRVHGNQPDVLALDRALEKLAGIDARQARLVELRFFGGLTFDEAAAVLDVAVITVKRDWALARTWLFRELGGSA
jgi:RNA polymerase sigma factor (TIGR02999 family)